MLALLASLPCYGADILPIHRVRFYETGVAWFERTGPVDDHTRLVVPASHLDDALKSLVVLGSEAEVGAITFPTASADDATQAAAGVGATTYLDVLRAQLGNPVTVTLHGGTPIHGLLLDVDGPLGVDADPVPTGPAQYALTVLGADGDLLRTTTDLVDAIRSDDDVLTERLRKAAATMSPNQAMRKAGIDLQLWRGGEVSLGYVAEAPVWQITYRVVTGDSEKARIQAWAIVHNDTDEDWHQCRVEVANGEPDSYVDALAAPRYATRELRDPDDGLSTVAQLATATPDQLLNGTSSGYGSGGGVGYGVAGAGSLGGGGIDAVAEVRQADAVETPTQFVYRVAEPIELPAHHTAMVSLVHEPVPIEAVVAFFADGDRGRAGLWLTNTTDRTLPEGVVSVVEGGGLAGESTLERLKPEESQLVVFGTELDLEVERATEALEPRATAVTWLDGRLVVRSIEETDHTLTVHNRSGRPRAVWVELDLPEDARLLGKWRTVVDPHRGVTWLVVDAAAGPTDHVARIEEATDQDRDPTTVSAEELRGWAQDRLGDPGRLRAAADRRGEVDEIDADLVRLRAELDRVKAELDGVREDLRAVGDNDRSQVLVHRAADLETEVAKRADRIAEDEIRRAEALDAVLVALQGLQAS